jgi:hypothetical protein
MKKGLFCGGIVAALGLFSVLLAGCGGNNPEITKDSFKRGQMPPEAQKGMAEAMKKAGPPPNLGK